MKAKGIDTNGNVEYFTIMSGVLFCNNNNLTELDIPDGCKEVGCDDIILHNMHDLLSISIYI